MHCITIDAPPEQVWRWLIQTGQDRAGFYSYDWIERLFGYDMRNADRIHPEWQQLAVGDRVRLHQATTPLEVVHLVEGRVVVLAGGSQPASKSSVRIRPDRRMPRLFAMASTEGWSMSGMSSCRHCGGVQ